MTMEDTYVYLLGFALIAVVLPVLRRRFRSGKNSRDFELKRRSGKLLEDFDEAGSFVDKYSR